MPFNPPFVVKADAIADATGVARASVRPRGSVDYVILYANVFTDTSVLVPTGVANVNGQQRDSTDTGSSATSDTRIVLRPGDVYEFVWTGADVGTGCHLIVNGIQYDAYQAPAE